MSFLPVIKIPIRPSGTGHMNAVQISKNLVESARTGAATVLEQLRRFILYIGPISSIFDYATFFIMLFIYGAWAKPDASHQALFHTAWFVESLFTQTLIIHVIRTKKSPSCKAGPAMHSS